MTQRSRWLDPTSVQAAFALAIAVAAANGVWIFLDRTVPSWDQSHYLSIALQYQRSFEAGGLAELLHAVYNTDPSHGPLLTILLAPFLHVFGASARSGLLLNLAIAPVLYFSAGQIAWIVFRNWGARLLTIALMAAMPLMVGLFHNVLQDFLLITLVTLSLLLLLESHDFQRRWTTWAMALTMGLGTLTKVTFPLFVLAPILLVLAHALNSWLSTREKGAEQFDSRRALVNLGGAAAVYLVVALVWYGPNFDATLEYVRSTTGGELAVGAGPGNPYTFHAVASFTTLVLSYNVSWIIAMLGLAAVALNMPRLLALFRQPWQRGVLWNLAFLVAWAGVPYLSVALAHNQDVRLMAPAMPAVAILVAGAVAAVRQPVVRGRESWPWSSSDIRASMSPTSPRGSCPTA